MFYLHLSNKTENLIRQLTEVLSLVSNRDPFHPEYFLIQSQGMERMLSQHLSERFVSWCNYEYLLPTRFFALMADRLGLENGPEDYAREKLSWRLEQILRSVDGEEFSALRAYVSGDAAEMKRYQLAGHLAYVFDQYQIMRPDMVDGWENGRLSCRNNKSAEQYQMKLWNILRAAIGHSRHRGVFLRDLVQQLRRKKNLSELLPERLSVFGLHSMPPVFLQCIQALSLHCHVHFYLLSPCENYWGDQMRVQSHLRQDNMESLANGHPLLQSLGQQGREFQNMLSDVDVGGEFKSFAEVFREERPRLLQKIQSDLLGGEVLQTGTSFPKKDDSLAIVSAHSPHREMMILRDRILYWLDHDPDLELKDIVVMAPEIQDYSALIPALFHDIPHSIADRNPVFSNTYIATFIQLLKLCSGRFGWGDVLDLLEREEVYPRFEIAENDLGQIRHWVQSSGIRWGLSGKQRGEMGLPGGEECTWKSGLERLLMGYAVNADETVHSILPYEDIEGGMAAPLGGLSRFCEILEQTQKQFSRSRKLADWSALLSACVEKIFVTGADAGDDCIELYKILAGLDQEYGDIHDADVSFEVICSWVEAAATEKKSSSGFLRGQLTFCSMLPMRSIPFQKVCLLGLNDSVFPKNDSHPPFDLLGEDFRPGDRSRRSDDRYQFLEAILSARDSLYLSYVGQSIRSNDQFPPSVVVSELIELTALYGVSDPVEHHPLHGFAEKYFRNGSPFFTYNEKLTKVAAALQQIPPDPQPWWDGAVSDRESGHVTVDALFSFFAHPQKYFVRNILGLYLESATEQYEAHEPFVLDSLQAYLIDQKLVGAELTGQRAAEQGLYKMQVAGEWLLGTPGKIKFVEKESEQQLFVEQLKAFYQSEILADCLVNREVAGVRITGTLGNLAENGSLLYRYANVKGRDLLSAWMHHCLKEICLPTATDTRLLGKDAEFLFPAGTGGIQDLETCIAFFQEGQKRPLPLLLEPALAYAIQFEKSEKNGKGDPVAKAITSYNNSMRNGYEAEWELLYQGKEIDEILGEECLEMCNWFYNAVWKKALLVRKF